MQILSADDPAPHVINPSVLKSLAWIAAMFALQGIGLVLAILVNVALGADIRSPDNANPITLLLGVLLGNFILIALRSAYLKRNLKRVRHQWHIGISAGAIAAMLIVNWAYESLLVGKDVQPTNRLIADAASSSLTGSVLVFLAIAITGPILEEVLFRGQLQSALKQWGERREINRPATIAMTVSAAVFAAIHFQPLAFPVLFTSGLAMGWIREKTGSITLPILMHVIMNTVAVFAMTFSG